MVKLVFQLFDDLVPSVTNRIATLADSGFYDGIVFHRILNNFVMQAGDPLGNGTVVRVFALMMFFIRICNIQ